jgi:phage gp36-like protein
MNPRQAEVYQAHAAKMRARYWEQKAAGLLPAPTDESRAKARAREALRKAKKSIIKGGKNEI